MNRLLQVAKLGTLLALMAYCYVACTFYVRVGAALQAMQGTLTQFNAQSAAIAANANAALRGAAATMDAINRPCGDGQRCGTLADVAKTLGTLRGTAGEMEIAAHHEDARIGVLDAQEATIYADTHRSLAQLGDDLTTADTTIAGLQPVLAGLNAEASELRITTASANTLLSDPQIPAILAQTEASTRTLNSALGHVNATVADTQQAVHAWLHPSWPRKVWNGVQSFAVDIGRVLF